MLPHNLSLICAIFGSCHTVKIEFEVNLFFLCCLITCPVITLSFIDVYALRLIFNIVIC